MEGRMLTEISRLRQMTVAELRVRWRELYGDESRSRNREFLWRRLAWRTQELALGGLSDRARSRIDQLAPNTFTRARTPTIAPARIERSRRDPRLPAPGTIITKLYKGREIRATVRDDGVEHDGQMFGSLTAVAKHVTGSTNINGRLFFGLTGRRRK